MKRILVAIAGTALLLLSSCNRAYEVHTVDGVSGKFCMPKSYAIGRIPWIPSNVPEGEGFAFSGCWRGDLKQADKCAFPKSVIGGVVNSSSNFRRQQWRDLDEESLIKRTIRDGDALLEAMDDGQTIVASNSHKYWGWFVWHKAQSLTADTSANLEPEDELIATCQRKDVALPGTSKTRPAILCERQAQGKEYALNYSFESKERVPRNVEALDVQVFAQLDRWRCQK